MIGSIIGDISGFMYSKLLIIMLLAVGLYFTVKCGFLQIRMFGESVKVVGEKPDKEGSVSSFQALMVSTASRVGTGNIVGISTALCMGGFGSVEGAIVGGLIMGLVDSLTGVYFNTAFKYLGVCVIFMLILQFKPKGLFGGK